jgi:ATP-binding cassette subfamily B protein
MTQKIEALNISFYKKGETIAILGKTGSGKSSLLSLISRLYDTTTGSIKIDQNEKTLKPF